MKSWNEWITLAEESLSAAQLCKSHNSRRSAVNRAYYSAFQAATACIHYDGQDPPEGRDAWSHETTPEAFRASLKKTKVDRGQCNDLVSRLSILYKFRVQADYIPSQSVFFGDEDIKKAVTNAGLIFKTVKEILPSGVVK